MFLFNIAASMHRIAPPLRASQSSCRLCCARTRRVPLFSIPVRTAFAAFSTGQPRNFLLSGKQDKKKHQQFVRRWQKRLLGESEPIGAHVDPYDPTSPVRIAPEEQGEYEEVLDDDPTDNTGSASPSNQPARIARGRVHVGGEQWQKARHQVDLAREYEKLTLRTYTPLSLDMASDIEQWTGTWYTLKDENLLMAQTIHNTTGRPYTPYNFGLRKRTTNSEHLRLRFQQAVIEVYALRQAGLNMDLSKLANSGIYERPSWFKEIKLVKSRRGKPVLAFPRGKSVDQLVKAMQAAPVWESSQVTEEGDLHVEEIAEVVEVVEDKPPPVMDPDTPDFKKAALVKTDPDKKAFDFMSNRPVSRTKSAEKANTQEINAVAESERQSSAPSRFSMSVADLTSAVDSSRATISQTRHDVFEHQVQHLATKIQALRQQAKLPHRDPVLEELKWHDAPLTENSVKFALFKRLLQLTGLGISDPQLTMASTLGDLYGFLCAAAVPKSSTLFSTIHIQGQKARERAKQPSAQASIAPTSTPIKRTRADLGDLITLGNVEIRRTKPSKQELREQSGIGKVIQFALRERGLARKTGKPKRKAPLVKVMRQM